MTDQIATSSEPVSAPDVPNVPDNLRGLLARARAAARELERPDEPMTWSAALAAAPWPKGAPRAFEGDFRKAFAEGLVKRGAARAALPTSHAGDGEGRSAKRQVVAGQATTRRLLTASVEEFEEQDRRAKAEGVSWSTWARRKLARAE